MTMTVLNFGFLFEKKTSKSKLLNRFCQKKTVEPNMTQGIVNGQRKKHLVVKLSAL